MRKMKCSPDADFEPSHESATQPSKWAMKKHGIMSRATTHNLAEKRYRSNLNEKMVALHDCIPSLKSAADSAVYEGDSQVPSRKPNKVSCDKGNHSSGSSFTV
jgi:Helix-loop-helix DNA-binding domain